ncbi:histidine kinase dimerization/phosphoacceptor domain -containing protein [Pseudoxanthobacter sp. M-2]|uniref:sensor histidine kinase n=1 Tax=Pseudoxanthobacter sp. M-2 TaxID=3078754 RepID=UPI0038FD3D72
MSVAGSEPSVAEFAMRLSQQKLVAEFGLFAMQQANGLHDILQEASRVAADGLQTRFAKVLQHQPGEADFLVCAGVGWQPGVVGHARIGGDLASPAGYAFRTQRPVISNHLSDEERFRTPELLARHGIKSALNVVIRGGDAPPFGVLEGDSTDRHDFGDHDSTFLQSLANTLAAALEMQARQEARDRLLHEKDLLMKEVHHRVENSLQLVRSILQLQARSQTSTEVRVQLEEAASRISAIGAVHHRLHAGGSVETADLPSYFDGLMGDVRQLLPGDDTARPIAIDSPQIALPVNVITPLGLITMELITNSLKYGSGPVRVTIRPVAGAIEVAVVDDGHGFPVEFDPAMSRGLGMRLVRALCRPAGGVEIDRSVPHARVVARLALD